MREFTELERAVLDAICEGQSEMADGLRKLLATAQLTERDNTGHGFYTSFEVDKSTPPLELPERLLDGPNGEVAVGGETLLMGFILWCDDGYPNCLEGFQYGTRDGGNIDLKTMNLSSVRWLRPMS